jgi:hypothetical protein
MRQSVSCAIAFALSAVLETVPAAAQKPAERIVQLQEGTATYSQTCCGFDILGSPALAIDGIFSDIFGQTLNGWAVVQIVNGVETSKAETAVWETASDVGPGPLRFVMFFLHANPKHLLGRFRFSATTDDRALFADGLPENGAVTANWTVLTPKEIQGPAGMAFLRLPDDSILAGGEIPGSGTYEVRFTTNLSGITGVRLEALEHESLPNGGPGFYYSGNFVLTELQMYAIPHGPKDCRP